ncbi:MAG: flavoprotein, partial [Clostridiales bacterium]|nr:flavoprotein [Clostridiales bacterium]
MNGLLSGKKIGFAMTGSFCTFSQVFPEAQRLADEGAELYPILSDNVWSLDTRFYTAEQVKSRLETICGRPIWHTLPEVEPIGPKHLLDLVIIAPCTGNSLGKLACGIIDTPV